MRAGSLRHAIDIQYVTETQDVYGAVVETWSKLATVRAGIFQLSGREFFAAKQVNSDITTKLVIRYHDELGPKMRAVIQGTRRYFDFQAVVDKSGMGRELEILAIERKFPSPYIFSTDFSADFS